MSRVAKEDLKQITHINFICDRIHDCADEIYEGMMDREYEEVKNNSQKLIKELSDLIQSLTDET